MELLDGVRTQKEQTRLVLNNILFATDFSPSSEMALRYALTLARHYHAKIHIIQALARDWSKPLPATQDSERWMRSGLSRLGARRSCAYQASWTECDIRYW